jgi:hypothetical protein
VYCCKHKSHHSSLKNATDFRVQRILHLEIEGKRKQKWFDLRSVRVYIGGLQVSISKTPFRPKNFLDKFTSTNSAQISIKSTSLSWGSGI